MTTTLDSLLEDLAAYLGMPADACVSLPPAAYTSPALHALERERIFRRSWLCVGRDEYVPDPGDYYRIDVLDEPMIVVRATASIWPSRRPAVSGGRSTTTRHLRLLIIVIAAS